MILHNGEIGGWRHDNRPAGWVVIFLPANHQIVMSPSANILGCVMPICPCILALWLLFDVHAADLLALVHLICLIDVNAINTSSPILSCCIFMSTVLILDYSMISDQQNSCSCGTRHSVVDGGHGKHARRTDVIWYVEDFSTGETEHGSLYN